jgi:DNA-binding transcriptional regulator LsrR (DeoR family)
MNNRPESGGGRLDDAARAGWLYYVAGNTQDQIAAKLGISRQTAQRLVSLAVSERLIKVRVDHPIANCLDLAARLKARFALDLVEVVPSDPTSQSTTVGIAEAAASEIEKRLLSTEPIVMAIGTGRTL